MANTLLSMGEALVTPIIGLAPATPCPFLFRPWAPNAVGRAIRRKWHREPDRLRRKRFEPRDLRDGREDGVPRCPLPKPTPGNLHRGPPVTTTP
jgi:hypothetical protein